MVVVPAVPLNVTVPVPALKVPLLVQFPLTSRLNAPFTTSEPLIEISRHMLELSVIVTVIPAGMTTSSPNPGTIPQLQVPALFQSPEAVSYTHLRAHET